MLLNKMLGLYRDKYKVSLEDYELMVRYQKLVNICSKTGGENIRKEEKLKKNEIIRAKETIKKVPFVFLSSRCHFHKFKKRFKLAYRKINHVSVKSSQDLEPSIANFMLQLHNLRLEHEYPLELIINFDETPMFFDMIPSYSYEQKGVKRVEVKASNLEKKRLTAGLAISAAGYKLRPILIYKGTGSAFRKLRNSEGKLTYRIMVIFFL